MAGSRLRQDLLCVGQQRRPAQRQRQPHECVCSQRFPFRRTSFGQLQIGLDGRYNTKYYAPGYNPALSVYYNQREVETGNYPYMDAFVMGKWKRMRIFLKYQHVNKGLFGNGEYFSAARYPLNPGMFKIGISWGFYD